MKNLQFYQNQLEEIRNIIDGGLITLEKSKHLAEKALKELNYEINVVRNNILPDIERKIEEINKERLVKDIYKNNSFLQFFLPDNWKKKYGGMK